MPTECLVGYQGRPCSEATFTDVIYKEEITEEKERYMPLSEAPPSRPQRVRSGGYLMSTHREMPPPQVPVVVFFDPFCSCPVCFDHVCSGPFYLGHVRCELLFAKIGSSGAKEEKNGLDMSSAMLLVYFA